VRWAETREGRFFIKKKNAKRRRKKKTISLRKKTRNIRRSGRLHEENRELRPQRERRHMPMRPKKKGGREKNGKKRKITINVPQSKKPTAGET